MNFKEFLGFFIKTRPKTYTPEKIKTHIENMCKDKKKFIADISSYQDYVDLAARWQYPYSTETFKRILIKIAKNVKNNKDCYIGKNIDNAFREKGRYETWLLPNTRELMVVFFFQEDGNFRIYNIRLVEPPYKKIASS